MQRKKSLLAATIISAIMLTGAVAYAASGVFDGRDDNVGNLESTAIQPTDVTLFIDPATGSVSSTKPAAAPAAAAAVTASSAAVTATPTDDSGHDSDDDIGDDKGGDRRYGRGGDDD